MKAEHRQMNSSKHFNVDYVNDLKDKDAWPGDTAYVSHGTFGGQRLVFSSLGGWESGDSRLEV